MRWLQLLVKMNPQTFSDPLFPVSLTRASDSEPLNAFLQPKTGSNRAQNTVIKLGDFVCFLGFIIYFWFFLGLEMFQNC